MNAINSETIGAGGTFSFFSRPSHSASYQDQAKIARLLFPKKGNHHQLSHTAESIHLQFPEDGPSNSYDKENILGFQSVPDTPFGLNESETNGSYIEDGLQQFSPSNELPFPAASSIEEAEKRWSI